MINSVDEEIIKLLSKRSSYANEIGRHKQKSGLPVFDGERERSLLERLRSLDVGCLQPSAVETIFTEIISACRAVQQQLRISYLGPEATFTHLAAQRRFGRSTEYNGCDSIVDVFKDVESGQSDFGVVPVENSNEGAVTATLDRLAVSDARINGEIFSHISHALMSKESNPDRIERIYSHPQALSQCLNWLADKLPGRALLQTASTAAAARVVSEEAGSAAVGSAMLADRYALNVLEQDIQDRRPNITRFFIIGRNEVQRTGRDKTSIMFSTLHQPGALAHALAPFARNRINMTRIESRPSKTAPWEYLFFLDLEGHIGDSHMIDALDEVRREVTNLKLLGSYPMGAPENHENMTPPVSEPWKEAPYRINPEMHTADLHAPARAAAGE